MNHFRTKTAGMSRLALVIAMCTGAGQAQDFSNVVDAQLLTGWHRNDGTHMAGLMLTLTPGWKTYWRAPGDSGIPPVFSWDGSKNLDDVTVLYPVPQVFHDGGGRTIGYKNGSCVSSGNHT